jgi:hypothetical protein
MVWCVLLRPLMPELNGQDPFQICGGLCQTRKKPTLVAFDTRDFFRPHCTCENNVILLSLHCKVILQNKFQTSNVSFEMTIKILFSLKPANTVFPPNCRSNYRYGVTKSLWESRTTSTFLDQQKS